ncbi:hypothetical protein QYF36_022031 [Acer negundo]|nr:hypothetical protein QYF36_022031 [Acer negundo]
MKDSGVVESGEIVDAENEHVLKDSETQQVCHEDVSFNVFHGGVKSPFFSVYGQQYRMYQNTSSIPTLQNNLQHHLPAEGLYAVTHSPLQTQNSELQTSQIEPLVATSPPKMPSSSQPPLSVYGRSTTAILDPIRVFTALLSGDDLDRSIQIRHWESTGEAAGKREGRWECVWMS